ncbi:ATP-binding cassette domain-containing protein [Shewanella salipaludis]
MTLLLLKQASLGYAGKMILAGVDFRLRRGERVAILGPSGTGKSTLVQHLYQRLKSEAALCAQSQGLVEGLSLYHNIYMGALARHNSVYNLFNLLYPFKKNRLEVTELCRQLELDSPLATQVGRLSGGQRQRVALGRALYQEQPVFIGDEPFSALDPAMGQRLLELVFSRHATVVMVLHDKQLALNNFDRILGLKAGRVAFDLPSAEVDAAMLAEFYTGMEAPPRITPHDPLPLHG